MGRGVRVSRNRQSVRTAAVQPQLTMHKAVHERAGACRACRYEQQSCKQTARPPSHQHPRPPRLGGPLQPTCARPCRRSTAPAAAAGDPGSGWRTTAVHWPGWQTAGRPGRRALRAPPGRPAPGGQAGESRGRQDARPCLLLATSQAARGDRHLGPFWQPGRRAVGATQTATVCRPAGAGHHQRLPARHARQLAGAAHSLPAGAPPGRRPGRSSSAGTWPGWRPQTRGPPAGPGRCRGGRVGWDGSNGGGMRGQPGARRGPVPQAGRCRGGAAFRAVSH